MKVLAYKPHIDGLRALAVLPVIFFHADIKFFDGGYVGVDIFFVISGYLITNIIIKDLLIKNFSLKKFYLRRSRRILPVLLFITIISLLASLVLMSNDQLEFFSKQTISVIFFISNFFFWKNTGYFAPNAELQPLLHTWSLSVEEQFYIFFPIFLIFVWNFFRNRLVILLLVVSIFSFVLSQFGGNFKIQNLSEEFPFLILPFDIFWQAGSANFYLPFGRAWELLAGSLTCLFVNKKKIIDKKSNDIFTVIGAILIIISIFTYSSNIQYPSLFTLLPVIGTVLLIVYSTNSTHVCKILSYKPLVFFGLISFSLYLWHQPLLAFSRLYYGVDLSLNCKMLILATTFFFSYLTWRFIETPFRNKKIISDKKVIISILTVALMILLLSLSIYFSKITGFQKPLPSYISKTFESENPKNCFDLPYAHLDKSEWYCEIGEDSKNITFAVFGDSHALSLKQAFDKAGLTQNKKGIFSGLPGCPALLGINSLRSDVNIRNCKLLNKKMYDFVKKNDLKKIFLISRWTYYTVGNINQNNLNLISKEGFFSSNQNSSKSAFIFGLNNTIKNYQNLNVDVYFIHQVPEQFYDPKYVYQKSLDRKQNKVNEKKLSSFAVTFKEHLEHQKFIKDNLKIKSKEFSNLKEIDFDNIFCNNKKCLHGTQKTSYYSDTHHLSKAGSMKTLNAIKKLID